MTFWRLVVGTIIFWYASEAALVYGDIWDVRANPIKHVEVVFSKDKRRTGTLSRGWEKNWILTTSDGLEVRFSKYEEMNHAKPLGSRELGERWRNFFPLVLLSIAYLMYFQFEFVLLRRSTAAADRQRENAAAKERRQNLRARSAQLRSSQGVMGSFVAHRARTTEPGRSGPRPQK